MTAGCRLRMARKARGGFTMVEIAISIAVIGFALVAIIGVLPTAMRVQQDNRADTLIDQDGVYLMEAIRHGSQGLDDLPSYVVDNNNHQYTSSQPTAIRMIQNSVIQNIPDRKVYDTGAKLIGLLSTPRTNNDGFRVEAEFRAISGAAVEKDPNSVISFDYLLISEVIPFSSFDWATA